MSQEPVGDEISTQSDSSVSRLERLASQFNLGFIVISLLLMLYMRFNLRLNSLLEDLAFFRRLPDEEVADRMTVFVLLFLIAIGFAVLPRAEVLVRKKNLTNITATTTTLLFVVTFSWRWGDPTFDQYNEVLWYGWGDKLAILLLALALIISFVATTQMHMLRNAASSNLISAVNLGSLVVIAVYYVPSVIQPFKGIIDTYHSRYLLNDLLILSSGRMPFTEITPQYVGLLGWPIKLISFLPADFVVNSSLVWVNALVVIEITMLVVLAKRALDTKFWAIAALIPIATMFIKVQPNYKSWGSLASHINLIPGRTVLPVLVLLLLSSLAVSGDKRSASTTAFLLGIVCLLTPFNNVEFGLPASIASLIVLTFLIISKTVDFQVLKFFITGVLSCLVLVIVVYTSSGTSLTLSNWLVMIRAHGLDGFMNLAMPFIGLWVFFYAVLGASAILGSSMLFRELKTRSTSASEIRSMILLAFGGLWGSATLFYFSGRSLVPEIVVFLIPLAICIVGFTGLAKNWLISDAHNQRPARSNQFRVVYVPIFALMLIPLISISHAPNPAFEWLRMAGTGERWSSRAIKQLPKYRELKEIVESNPKVSYVYMGDDGPAIELMSGVENGLGIILLHDLLIGEELKSVGCAPAFKSGADFALIPKADWANPPEPAPCDGFVLQPVDPDSEFLIYQIPSKVSS